MADTVYLLHFSEAYCHARHYVGFTKDLESRLADHLAGNGSRLLEVVKDAGITWTLARTWNGDRKFERLLKNRKKSPQLCPICAGAFALRRACTSTDNTKRRK